MTNDKPRQRRNCRPTNATSRLTGEQLTFMEWLFPGFRAEYEATHDATGKPTTLIPGLKYIGDDRYAKTDKIQ